MRKATAPISLKSWWFYVETLLNFERKTGWLRFLENLITFGTRCKIQENYSNTSTFNLISIIFQRGICILLILRAD